MYVHGKNPLCAKSLQFYPAPCDTMIYYSIYKKHDVNAENGHQLKV